MSEAPKKIYMQYGEKSVLPGSWCEKRIDAFNVEYIRADLVDRMREAAQALINNLPDCVIDWAREAISNTNAICIIEARDNLKAALEAGKVDE